MSSYLTVIAGVLKLLNWAAAALQQHHDEVSGENKVLAKVNAERADVDAKVLQTVVSDSDRAAAGRLRDGRA